MRVHFKATLHYLQELQPSTIDPSLDPDALQPKALATLGFVWLYILAYMWRGLFKAGFREICLTINVFLQNFIYLYFLKEADAYSPLLLSSVVTTSASVCRVYCVFKQLKQLA